MKKQNKSFKLFSLLVAAFFILSSCQIGLGEAIDLQAPEIFLTSHKDNDYVGQTFRLAGYATDNEKVKSITIDFDEANIHYKWENSTWQKKTSYIDWTALTADECACTVNNTTVTWEVTVNTTEAKAVRRVFEIKQSFSDMTLKRVAEFMKAEGYKGRKGADFNAMLVKRILDKENFYRGYYNYGGIESVGEYEPLLS